MPYSTDIYKSKVTNVKNTAGISATIELAKIIYQPPRGSNSTTTIHGTTNNLNPIPNIGFNIRRFVSCVAL